MVVQSQVAISIQDQLCNIKSLRLSLDDEGCRNSAGMACVPQHIQDGEANCCALDYKLGGVRVARSECGHRLDDVSWHQRLVFLGDCYATTETEAVDLFYNLIGYTVHC
jgi:hypothetical protein